MTDTAGKLIQLLGELGVDNVDALNVTGATATITGPVVASASLVTLAHATPVLTLPVLTAGQRKTIILLQDGTGSRVPSYVAGAGQTLAWDTISGAAITLQTAATSEDIIELFSPDGTIVIAKGTQVAGVVAFTATYDTAATTIPAATVAAVATTGSTTSTPYGYNAAAQADAIPVAINALTADTLALKKLIVQIVKILGSVGVASGA